MTQENLKPRFCMQCGGALPGEARFCPGCGNAIIAAGVVAASVRRGASLAPLTFRNAASVVVVSLALVVSGLWLASDISGRRPERPYEEVAAKSDSLKSDPVVKKLRAEADAQQNSKTAWQALSEALMERLHGSDQPSQQLVFDTIEALRHLLDIDEGNSFALLGMAEISLNQQVFDKAADYYAKYLAKFPSDKVARARYASALAFVGKADQAVTELNTVLKEDPNNFHALAYLAVTYAQLGNKPLAIKTGERALKSAPSEEARARFASFIDSVKQGKLEQKESAGSEPSNPAPAGASSLMQIEAMVRAQPIAGPKFVRAQEEAGQVKLYFKDFPMEQMPEAVRGKFTKVIAAKVREISPKTSKILFFDEATGAELSRVE